MRGYLAGRAEAALRKLAERRGRAFLTARADLWRALQEYLSQTRSTGCSVTDYWVLYREIIRLRPLEVLECGTGVSTLVIAHALADLERTTGRTGRVTSMEEHREWLDLAVRLLPPQYARFVDFRLSTTVEDRWSLFRGVRYADTPPRAYDFVFVDGPSYVSPEDGTPTFDFDFIHVLRSSERPVAGLIDKRVSTCFVLQQILGPSKVKYSPVLGVGTVAPCRRQDLGNLDRRLSSANFEASFRLVGRTRLTMPAPRMPN